MYLELYKTLIQLVYTHINWLFFLYNNMQKSSQRSSYFKQKQSSFQRLLYDKQSSSAPELCFFFIKIKKALKWKEKKNPSNKKNLIF